MSDEISAGVVEKLERHKHAKPEVRANGHDWKAKHNAAVGVAPLVTLDPLSLQDKPVPPRDWLVEGLIPVGDATLFYGDGGVGKSLLSLQLLVATALGQQWLGRPTKAGKAIGIYCEDDRDELHRRLADILKFYDADFGDLVNLILVPRLGYPNELMVWEDFGKGGEPTIFWTQIHSLAAEFGAHLIVLDSLHDFYIGNENNRVQPRQFMNSMRHLASDFGNVIINAHPSRSGMATGSGDSGSTAWNAATRSRLYLDWPRGEEDQTDDRVLRQKKANYSRNDAEIKLRWDMGVFKTVSEPTGAVAAIERGNHQNQFLAALRTLNAQGRACSHSVNARNFAPRMMAGMAEVSGLTVKQLSAAMDALFAAGRLKANEVIGQRANRHQITGLAEVILQQGED